MAITKKLAIGLTGIATAAAGALASRFFLLGIKSHDELAPGLVNGTLAACPNKPNCVSSEAGTPEKRRVEPLPLDSWARLPIVVTDMGGELTVSREDYIAAEFQSAVFQFVDDLELRKGEDAVHVRSASRVGHSDAGVNARRVANLRAKLAG